MSGVQSVLNHLRFARHWLAKAETEFQRAEPLQGELSLSLVEAEVRKAWTESQRAMRLVRLSFAPKPLRRSLPASAVFIGAVALVLAVAGFGAVRLVARPAAAPSPPTTTLPGTARQALASVKLQAVPLASAVAGPEPASPKEAPQVVPQVAQVAQVAQVGKVPEPPRPVETAVAQPAPPPAVQVAPTAVPKAAGTPAPPARSVVMNVPQPLPAVTLSPVSDVPFQGNLIPVRPAGESHPAAPPAEKPAPQVPTAADGGGTPLPLDLVELVRIAEQSLTGPR